MANPDLQSPRKANTHHAPRGLWFWLLGVLLTVPRVQAAGRVTTEKSFTITWGVKIPTRDGVRLNATLYQPMNPAAATPAILTLTPYEADQIHNDAAFFARNGYAFAAVDCRGRGNSEGRFEPRVRDGLEIGRAHV